RSGGPAMARPWWQRLWKTDPKPETRNPNETGSIFGFRISDFGFSGWWVRAESKPVRAWIAAAAKPVPALLTAWTFHATPPDPAGEPLVRGDERLAALCEWGLEFGGVA